MLNHDAWFLAKARQACLIESSLSKDTKKIWPTALSKTFQSTSKNNTYSAHLKHPSITHINRTSTRISTHITTSQHIQAFTTFHCNIPPNHITQPTEPQHHRVQSPFYQNIPTPNLPKHTTAGYKHILE